MKKSLSLILACLMLFSLCACGSSSYKDSGGYSAQSNSSSAYYSNSVEAPAMAAMDEAVYYEESGFSAYDTVDTDSPRENDAPEENPDKIIYSSNVTVETTEFDETLSRLDALIKENKGWVESSSVNGANFYDVSRGYTSTRSADYTLRIPSDRFDALMNSLSTLGNVPYSHTYTENVTAQYYDVQARLTAYKTQETRLLEMMEVAETVEDIILLEDRLTELRYEIESLQSSLNNWDRRVSYSTVYLSVQEVLEYTPEVEVRLSFGQQLARAFSNGLKSVADFFKDFLLWFLEALPSLAVLAVVIVLAVFFGKKISAHGKKRKEAKQAAKAAQMAAYAAQRQQLAQHSAESGDEK